MAAREDLEFTYSLTDRIFRLSLGEPADLSAAKYDGDFSLCREEAQRRKHCYVAEQIGIDLSGAYSTCAVGGARCSTSSAARAAGGVGRHVVLRAGGGLPRHGLDVHLHDAREVTRDTFGPFDEVARLGPSSTSAHRRTTAPGARTSSIADSSPGSGACCGQGRFFLQTMVFGRSMIPAGGSTSARAGLRRVYLALMGRQARGSWLPHVPGADHSQRRAHFASCQA